jgi:hypothetical protein
MHYKYWFVVKKSLQFKIIVNIIQGIIMPNYNQIEIDNF